MSEEKLLTKEIIRQEIPKLNHAVDFSTMFTQIDDDADELLY